MKKPTDQDRRGIRAFLKSYSREDLLTIAYDIPWGSACRDYEKMKKVQLETAHLSDKHIIDRIIQRDWC